MNRKTGKWEWIVGQSPPPLDPHSKVKHQVITDYLCKYINVLMANERIPKLTLTLIDGFSGGGLYSYGSDTAFGSPLLLLKTVNEVNALLNIKRDHSLRKIDAQYHFVEFAKSNFDYLKHILNAEGYSDRIGHDIAMYCNAFEDICPSLISRVKQRKGGERALFLLDQYSYDDIKMSTMRSILSNLQGAEIILTFNVDSLLTFLSDTEQFHNITQRIGIKNYIDWEGYARLKAESRWRELIQTQLSYGILKASGAKFMTLFFVTPLGNTPWSYWLVHLSNTYKANDVMKAVHWDHGNSFGHSLGGGLFQIGYQANQDELITGQAGLEFSSAAAFDANLLDASIMNLQENLPRIIYDKDNGISFIELLEKIANRTNATADIVKKSLEDHIRTKEIQVFKADGGMRTKSSSIHRDDIIIPNRQKSIFLG